MNYLTLAVSLIALAIALHGRWQIRCFTDQVQLQVMKAAILDHLGSEGPVAIRTWSSLSTQAVDELLAAGIVSLSDGDSLLVLTDKGQRFFKARL